MVKMMLAAALAAGLASCAAAPRGSFCEIAQPIRPAKSDVLSDETVRQILTHDKTGARLCGWQP